MPCGRLRYGPPVDTSGSLAGLTLVLAAATFVFGRMSANKQDAAQRTEDMRRTRLETYAALCASIVETAAPSSTTGAWARTSARPMRSSVNARTLPTSCAPDGTAAWGQLYKVVMIANDKGVEQRARRAIGKAKAMKEAGTVDELNVLSDEIATLPSTSSRYSGVTVRERTRTRPRRRPREGRRHTR